MTETRPRTMNIRYPGAGVEADRRGQDEYNSLYGIPLQVGKVVRGVPWAQGEHLCGIGLTERVSDEEADRLEAEEAARAEAARLAELEAQAAAARAAAQPPAEPPAESQETERPAGKKKPAKE